jgi:hypothetical protein
MARVTLQRILILNIERLGLLVTDHDFVSGQRLPAQQIYCAGASSGAFFDAGIVQGLVPLQIGWLCNKGISKLRLKQYLMLGSVKFYTTGNRSAKPFIVR